VKFEASVVVMSSAMQDAHLVCRECGCTLAVREKKQGFR
jgi:hypothetical protein